MIALEVDNLGTGLLLPNFNVNLMKPDHFILHKSNLKFFF